MKIKKQKVEKKCFIKRKLKLQDYKNYLNVAKIDGKLKLFRREKI